MSEFHLSNYGFLSTLQKVSEIHVMFCTQILVLNLS